MNSNPGMRIIKNIERPEKNLIERFRNISTANIGDAMARLKVMHAYIQTVGKGKKLLGTALTVHSAMADNFIFHKALTIAMPGDVIVVNASGDMNHSVCGDVMYRYAISRGIAGFVIDGCVRDTDFLYQSDFPVFAVGKTPRGPYKIPVGEINLPVACCGQVVEPGDLIVGDEDGVAVIRKNDIETVYNKVMSICEKEDLMTQLIDQGTWEIKSPILNTVNEEIERLGFEIQD